MAIRTTVPAFDCSILFRANVLSDVHSTASSVADPFKVSFEPLSMSLTRSFDT